MCVALGCQVVQVAVRTVLDVEPLGGLAGQHHLVAPPAEKLTQPADGIMHAGIVVFADQADGMEGGLHEARL